MKEHFKQKIDDTKQAYLDALSRLQSGTPKHQDLKGKPFKINASTIALEAEKSRNPLYNTHKDILDIIKKNKHQSSETETKEKELSEVEALKKRIKELEEQNKKLINVNAGLLYRIKD